MEEGDANPFAGLLGSLCKLGINAMDKMQTDRDEEEEWVKKFEKLQIHIHPSSDTDGLKELYKYMRAGNPLPSEDSLKMYNIFLNPHIIDMDSYLCPYTLYSMKSCFNEDNIDELSDSADYGLSYQLN